MDLLDALFAGAKALLTEVSAVGRTVVREVLKEIDRSAFGRAATRLVDGVVDRYFKQARDLAEEERELAEKAQRDGRRTDADTDRLRKIEAERARLRAELERSNAERAAQEFRSRASETLVARLDDDEVSSSVGILAAKQCFLAAAPCVYGKARSQMIAACENFTGSARNQIIHRAQP